LSPLFLRVRKLMRLIFFSKLLFIILMSSHVHARGVYQEPDAFLQDSFENNIPKARVIWLTTDVRPVVEKILGHKPSVLRIRYWKKEQRTAWILEEIGKDKPITTGVVINQGRIERVKVLVFRESRGWEVRHGFFTDQFKGASINSERHLDKTIDGISGATLSVRALRKLSRLALYLDSQVKNKE